jgi:hypothetical protein
VTDLVIDAPPPAADEARLRRCFRCGYDLRGLPPGGNCPECGLAVERSSVEGDELWHAPPAWLAKLSWGARLVLLAPVLGFVYGTYFSRYVAFQWAEGYFIAPAAFALMFAVGVWLITARQPHVFQARRWAWRWALRAVSLTPLATEVYVYLVTLGRVPGLANPPPVLALIPFPALLFFHLRGLARRVLNPSLAEHCAIVGVGGSLSLAVLMAEMFVRIPRAIESVGVLVGAVGTMLFFAWTLYLMARFAIAFHRAHRASAAAWGER